MKNQIKEARLAVQKAREAMRNNNPTEARRWAEHAASLAPQVEDPWLILAAVASPSASMGYIQQALKINPNSPRAKKGLAWAQGRLPKDSESEQPQENIPALSPGLIGQLPRAEFSREQLQLAQPSEPILSDQKPKSKRSPLYPILLIVGGLLVCAFGVWLATNSPVMALLANNTAPTPPSHPASWALVRIAKPTVVTPSAPLAEALPSPEPQQPLNNLADNLPVFLPTATSSDTAQLSIVPVANTDVPTNVPAVVQIVPTDIPPTLAPTEVAALVPQDTPTAMPTAEPASLGGLTFTFVEDTPTSNAPVVAPAPTPASAPASGSQTDYVSTGGQRWIDVNLSQQMVYAYEGNSVVNSFLASTGTWQYPTVTGQYHIYVKYRYTDMTGPGYYLPNVPYTMYFYQGYGLHGTYWHHNFGTPMSHGCVNLRTEDAGWLFNWASVGTLVNVHY